MRLCGARSRFEWPKTLETEWITKKRRACPGLRGDPRFEQIVAGRFKRLLASLGRNEGRNTLFFHQEHDELRRFAVARVAADDVNVIRAFIERFAGFERDGLGVSQLHHDRTLDNV